MKPSSQNISDMRKLLSYMSRKGPSSISGMAIGVGWITDIGVPNKSKVRRIIASLERDGLVRNVEGIWLPVQGWEQEIEEAEAAEKSSNETTVDKLPLRMAWMLVSLKACEVYIEENYPLAHYASGLNQHADELDRLIREAAPLLLGAADSPADSQD